MDFLTDVLVWLLFLFNKIYAAIFGLFIRCFMPIARWATRRKTQSFGITLNGEGPLSIKIYNDNMFPRFITGGVDGICDAYVDKEIDFDVVSVLEKVLRTRRLPEILPPLNFIFNWFNLQTPRKAWEVGREHYDIDPDIFEVMLGEHLQYSCGYWKDAQNLKEAQEAKLHLIAKKLKLKPGMRLLDIGSGWGGLSKFMAQNYGVSVVGVTVAANQKAYCDKACQGLPIEIRLCDYRKINEKFDAIVSVGMFEHVGARNYKEYFNTARRCLKDDGLFLLHTMGRSHRTTPPNVVWLHKHIFPNGYIPHHTEVGKAVEEKFVIEDWHNFSYDYYLTFKTWAENFEKLMPNLSKEKHSEKFQRTFLLYLHIFTGIWKSRSLQLWQIVLSKDGLDGGYESIR